MQDSSSSGPWSLSLRNLVVYLVIGYGFSTLFQVFPNTWFRPTFLHVDASNDPQCPPPLPTLLAFSPPSPDNEAIISAKRAFDKSASKLFYTEKLDALAVAVITSNGSVYEGFWGSSDAAHVMGSEHDHPIDRHSVFRIVSISKVFACVEALMLRDRGVLNL